MRTRAHTYTHKYIERKIERMGGEGRKRENVDRYMKKKEAKEMKEKA